MGKSKIKKHKNRSTPNPYGLTTSENDIENCKLPSSTESAITSLLDQVPDAEENLCGLRRLSEVFFNDDKSILNDPSLSVNRELQQRFIKSVAPFLVDSRPDIRNAAAGALRNVSVAGGANICEIMVTDDVMTPLSALIQKYATDDMLSGQQNNISVEQEEFDKEKIDTLLQAIHLLLNLCETSETAVKYFNSNNLLTILLKFMNVSVGGIDLAVSVAQCLHTVSDENPTVLAALEKSEEDIAKIISVPNDEPSYLNLRTLTAGLLVNVHGGVAIKYSNYIFDVLGKVIEIDSRNELCRLSSEVPLDKEGMLSSDSVTKLEKLVCVIDTQITAFEILTNICSGEEDDNSMDVESVNDSDFEDENEETDCAMSDDVSVSYPLSVNTHIHEALIKLNFLKNSFSKTNLPINVIDILCNHTDTQSLVKKYQKLRCRAFHFLNNLVSVLDAEDLGSPDELFQMWAEITRMIISGKDDVEIVESSTTALRAVIKKLVAIQHPGLSQMSPSDLEILFKIVLHCKDNNVCVNVTQIVAALGVFCANKHLDLPLKSIGEFLIEIAGRQGPLWLVAEALDALMDVFAEDDTDVVAKEISLVPHLSSILPVFKKKVRSERKTLGDHYALVTTANSNLARFITYKNNHFRSTKNGSC